MVAQTLVIEWLAKINYSLSIIPIKNLLLLLVDKLAMEAKEILYNSLCENYVVVIQIDTYSFFSMLQIYRPTLVY